MKLILLLAAALNAGETATPLKMTLRGHKGPVSALAFSPDSTTLASGGRDHEIRLWDADFGNALFTLPGHDAPVLCLAFSPDGTTLASGGEDNAVRLWDRATGKQKSILTAARDHVLSVAFSPDGKLLAAAGKDSVVHIYDLNAGKSKELVGHHGPVLVADYFPDGSLLVSLGADSEIRIWRVKTGAAKTVMSGLPDGIVAAASSPDRAEVALALSGNVIALWNLESGRQTASLTGHTGLLDSVVFSQDGRLLASVGKDQTVRIWDVTGSSRAVLSGHTEWTSAAAFSPDGKTLASGSWDKTIRLWDLLAAQSRPAAVPTALTQSSPRITQPPAQPASPAPAPARTISPLVLLLSVFLAAGLAALLYARRKPAPPPPPPPPARTEPIVMPHLALASEEAPKKIVLSGKYEILHRSRVSPLGVLYEGIDRGLGGPVTIRKLRDELKLSGADIQQFLESAQRAATLRHPAILSVLAVLENEGSLYTVSAPAQGRTLTSLLEERQHLDIHECRRFLRDVVAALDHAHKAGVPHGDINPENLLIGPSGEATMIDFIVARLIKDADARSRRNQESPSIAYDSPERKPGAQGAGEDLYALAVTLYQALTGNLPFPGPDFHGQKREMLFADPSQIVSALPPTCGEFFRKALNPEPNGRFPGISELFSAF